MVQDAHFIFWWLVVSNFILGHGLWHWETVQPVFYSALCEGRGALCCPVVYFLVYFQNNTKHTRQLKHFFQKTPFYFLSPVKYFKNKLPTWTKSITSPMCNIFSNFPIKASISSNLGYCQLCPELYRILRSYQFYSKYIKPTGFRYLSVKTKTDLLNFIKWVAVYSVCPFFAHRFNKWTENAMLFLFNSLLQKVTIRSL